ncbi:amino acid adenylation domain-containing protein [Streptomyces cyanogenus]|uniref:Tyrocidine synthase 3 n=1 Tax=Streptomyces cyanogenus TaxID=80860 RepID=A0ABX7TJC5_STRCY|nr:amino acid adenylation domain-containing protein [Streptomyces cyanogenus]QTD96686.1 Tyrocidine synthase 3 [Streptomyces cyanogenus]
MGRHTSASRNETGQPARGTAGAAGAFQGLYRLVIDTAAAHGGRPAVVAADGVLTYAELDRRADALAHTLATNGVGPGDRVVIWSAKSCAAVVAMQAVLRLGAAYVPVDGSSPVGRMALVARDCEARVVCAAQAREAEVTTELPAGAAYVALDAEHAQPAGETPGRRTASPGDLAYILYTSGSTGTPKGVCISHGNAVAFVEWAVAELSAGPADRFANHAPFTFDLSVLDLYAAFAVGASVHLIDAELAYAPVQLTEFLYEHEISVWYSVPSALMLMMHGGGLLDRPAPSSLRAVLFAGEPFPVTGVRQLAAWTGARLLNLYGPTETNVCTFHEVLAEDLTRDRPVPIGSPSCGDTVWAVNDDGRARPGEEGELYVEGPTVMLGYWGRDPQRGPYATGDIVLVRPDGSFDYMGRQDHMVKVRGHRVELGEVEAALNSHPAVENSAVIVAGSGLSARLAAFVVLAADSTAGVLALKRHCAERLPPYMIADSIAFVPQLPHTSNGKVDRSALAGRLTAPSPDGPAPATGHPAGAPAHAATI